MNATTTDKVFITCTRCGGRGFMKEYSYVDGGRCFECDGAKGEWETAEVAAERAAADKRREAREAAAAAKRRANAHKGANLILWAEFVAAYPAEANVAMTYCPDETGRFAVGGYDILDEMTALSHAYSSVATYDRKDSNTPQALRVIRDYARKHGIQL